MSVEDALVYAEWLYKDNYRHWCAPCGWCREAAGALLYAFGDEADAYHYDVECNREYCRAYCDGKVAHVVVVYKGRVFDLTRAQFGKGVKRIIGADVSILEELYGEPIAVNKSDLP